MNKYQEAFTEIHHILEHSHLHGMGTLEQEHFDVIKALVDKETPMKPLSKGWVGGIMIFKCRNCNDRQNCIYNAPKRCGNCGKVIDWGKDDNS